MSPGEASASTIDWHASAMGGWVEMSSPLTAPRMVYPDPFEGKYVDVGYGQVRFTKDVTIAVRANGSRTRVLIVAAGAVRPEWWPDERRAFYGITR
jgi:hypothetical protein